MRQGWMSGVLGLLGIVAAACGGASPGADTAPAPVTAPAVVATSAPVAPVEPVRIGTKLGLAYTANVMGELEPCG